jgi:hypothetical protein
VLQFLVERCDGMFTHDTVLVLEIRRTAQPNRPVM